MIFNLVFTKIEQRSNRLKRIIADYDIRINKIKEDINEIKKKFRVKYEEQEINIAISWLDAVEKEPLFKDIN
jgi:hypothetical protein